MKARLLILLLIASLLGLGLAHAVPRLDSIPLLNPSDSVTAQLSPATRPVLTPPPLRTSLRAPTTTLTVGGTLTATNDHRQQHNLPALTLNDQLSQAAQQKIDDMFAQQYFEHVNPQGIGPSDLVDQTSYAYLRVGENLALGNFGSDTALVQAWMDSPGHRANILNQHFSQLGLAVKQGTFEGQTTWLAVQTFGQPLSDCPLPDTALQQEYETRTSALTQQVAQLTQQQTHVTSRKQELTQLAAEIEKLVTDGNAKIAAGNQKIAEGNNTSDPEEREQKYAEGEKLQAEGAALLETAKARQDSFTKQQTELNATITAYNTAQTEIQAEEAALQAMVNQLNQQIRQFNRCLEE